MYDTNEKPTTIGQRARKAALKIFLWSIPVAIVLTVIKLVWGIGF